MAFTYRLEKGSPLTEQELDDNFRTVANIAQSTADDINKKVTADTNEAKKQADESARQAAAAKSEADRASQITGLDTVADAIGLAAVPFPDVWIPFNDGLQMLAGFGSETKVGNVVVAKHANFERSTTATYIDKSGVLRTAAINEPRFEKQGLLIEGQSTNLIPWSEPTAAQAGLTSVGRVTASYTSAGEIVFTVSETTSPQWAQVQVTGLSAQAAGVMYSGSAWLSASKAGEYRLALISRPAGGGAETGMGESIGVYLDETPRRFSISRATAGNEGQIAVRAAWKSTGSMGESVTMHRVQIEALPFASSYIPTNGTAVTRAADKCWIVTAENGVAVDVTICATAYIESGGDNTTQGRRYILSAGDGTLNNCIALQGSNTTIGKWYYTGNSAITSPLLKAVNTYALKTSQAESTVWLNGESAKSSAASEAQPLSSVIHIAEGRPHLGCYSDISAISAFGTAHYLTLKSKD